VGKVKTEELDNGNIAVEITYGGLEAPYGGVDTSAPPAYIDPRCFTDSDGFLVVNNRLVAVAFEKVTTPTLWFGDATIQLLKFGTFYNSTFGQLNYALGYKAIPFAGPPSGVTYNFYITSWLPDNLLIFNDDNIPYTLFDSVSLPTPASITLGIIGTNAPAPGGGTGAAGNVLTVGAGGLLLTLDLSTSAGTGYGVNDIVEVTQPGAGGGWIIVNSIGGGGSIATFTVASPDSSNFVAGQPWIAGVDTLNSSCVLKIIGPGGTTTHTVNTWLASTKAEIVAAMVSAINATDPNVFASTTVDGFSIVLTALAAYAGTTGNAITVQDLSVNRVPTSPPPFYFECRTVASLSGGTNAATFNALRVIPTPISSADVGGTIYFAGVGPFILKYSGPGNFFVSTSEKGVGVIRKFAGSLIGLRDIPQLGEILQNQDMIFAWSVAGELDIWSPLDVNGDVTGAGFEQIADIGDYLSGLIIAGGTAFIIRSQGVSYATPTGNATLPFAINHIGLGDQGEGSQTSALCCQYDQIGAFVGNTDIFQVGSNISSIGKKIKTALFTALQSFELFLDSNACSVYLGGETFPLVAFLVDGTVYLFDTGNGTWMTVSVPTYATFAQALLGTFAAKNIFASQDQFQQTSMMLGLQQTGQVPAIYALTETVKNNNSISAGQDIFFPAEELLFGRDVTIDALYISYNAQVFTGTMQVKFYISGQLFKTLSIFGSATPVLNDTPTEIQIFPDNTTDSSGVFTAHSPQLEIQISEANAHDNIIRFPKITMFGSFDPKQRPV